MGTNEYLLRSLSKEKGKEGKTSSSGTIEYGKATASCLI
jgi:hypothetical protein